MIYQTPTLETNRLILKRGIKEDYQKVYEYDFRKLRNINGEFEYQKLDKQIIDGMEYPYDNSYDWIVYLKESSEPIANITADRENDEIKSIELAFNTHPDYWQKGYTTEALESIINYLFSKEYENIICSYDEGNFKSRNIIKKLGFFPYKEITNAWIKDGISITTYVNILKRSK